MRQWDARRATGKILGKWAALKCEADDRGLRQDRYVIANLPGFRRFVSSKISWWLEACPLPRRPAELVRTLFSPTAMKLAKPSASQTTFG